MGRRLAEALSGAVTTSRDNRESLDVHARLTAAVPSGRRIVVLGLRSGVGSTTVAALVAAAVAGRRSEPVLVVDAARSGTHEPLAGGFGVQPRKTLADLAAAPPSIASRDELSDHLTVVGRDVWLLPGAHGIPSLPFSPRGPAPDAHTYRTAVSGLSRFFDIVVTDLGSDADLQAGADLITGAHALCVVCDGSQSGITYAETLIRGLRDAGPQSWAGRTVILANALDENESLTIGTRLAARRAVRARVPIVLLRHDPALRGPISSGIATFSRHTHRAALRVGAALLDTAVPDIGTAPNTDQAATP